MPCSASGRKASSTCGCSTGKACDGPRANAYGAASILRLSFTHRRTNSAMPLTFEIRRALLRQYGSFTLAYSATYQPNLKYFGDERGVITFQTMGKTALVLSD